MFLVCALLSIAAASTSGFPQESSQVQPQFGVPSASPNPSGGVSAASTPGVGNRSPGANDVQVSSPSLGNQNETSIDVDPSDRRHLIAGANDGRNSSYTCAFYASFDSGDTWSELLFPVPSGGYHFAGDPATAIGPNGESYFSAIASERNYAFSTLYVGRSFDGGLTVPTWTPAVTSPPGGFQDKQFLAADLTAGPLRGTLYMTWTRFSNSFSSFPIYAVTSYDAAATWTAPSRVSESFQCSGACPAVGPNGELYVAWFDWSSSKIQIDVSLDGGMTFGTDVDVASVGQLLGIPNGSFRANSSPSLDVDVSGGPHDGNLYVCWGDDQGSHADVLFARSIDGGATWSTPIVVNDDGMSHSQWSPWLDVDANGNVNVGFFDRRLDPNDRSIDFWVARSSDGGVSFRPNVRVSDLASDPNTYPDGAFLGDYNGLAASDRSVHAMWTDGRNATNDVFTSRVQLDFFGDAETISASSGGVVDLTLNPGPLHAGARYMVIGSRSGTDPGYTFANGLVLPLNVDGFTRLTRRSANSPAFAGFAGTLDATGSGAATLNSRGPLNASLIGAQLDFSLLVDGAAGWAWASHPYRVTIVP